ncbi:tetratricopeptide repeat protein [Pontibacter sp. JH31]|uniref:Tetratricopeptide repeat protein n=1 Tax=Pontibacter aquaedesilientis TaxID=2766980 RepID=A0ABR7XN07_9BACT|nr:tetratricopeptide repeat protein [Pontibacter aquaedesilientis]MBD1399028.1 tetratricopeptide repeat protein [Pontibacter aquaedesilientis]
MKSLIAGILLIGLLTGGVGSISRINEYTALAAIAYQQGEYIEAIAAYEYLLEELEVKDEQLRLNLGHAYFRAGEMQKAQQQYTLLTAQASGQTKSVALLQIGAIAARARKYKQALSFFRNALIADPANDAARYNYELLKKYLDLRPELAEEEEEDNGPLPTDQAQGQQQPDGQEQLPPPDEEDQAPKPKKKPDNAGDQEEEIESQEQADNGQNEQPGPGNEQNQPDNGTGNRPENKDKQEASGNEPGDTKGMNPDNSYDPARPERSPSSDPAAEREQRVQTRNNRLQQMNINPEKARMMLEAMRHAEQQYIQQLPKKSTRKPDPSKPNW